MKESPYDEANRNGLRAVYNDGWRDGVSATIVFAGLPALGMILLLLIVIWRLSR
jgi:hypothetical protein